VNAMAAWTRSTPAAFQYSNSAATSAAFAKFSATARN
jgi:hypothetical protein